MLSLTTSPARALRLVPLLRVIDARSYDAIELNLPLRYGRGLESYKLPRELETFPKLRVHWRETDLGPCMKLTPSVRRNPGALVVTIDDDTVYAADSVFRLLRAQRAIEYKGVVCFHGFRGRGGVNFRRRHATQAAVDDLLPSLKREFAGARDLDVAEGFSMVAYPADLVDADEIERLGSKSPECFRSDDIVVSHCLERLGVPRFSIDSPPNTVQ